MSDPGSPRLDARDLLGLPALPCGADVDLLLEQAADGRSGDLDAHQRDCVHCQAALAELAALWAPVAELAGTTVSAPPGLTAAVMSQVRALVRDVWCTLQVTGDGTIRVATRVVAAMARDTARQVPGVRIALGRSTQDRLAAIAERATLRHRHPHAAVGVLGRTAAVDLAVAVTYGDPLHEIARAIQRHVIKSLRDNLGLQSVTVNIIVDDILDEAGQPEAGQPEAAQSGPGISPAPAPPADGQGTDGAARE